MIFYDLKFVFPFLAVYAIYLLLSRQRQNILIVLSSMYFYGLWDWRFLCLMGAQIIVDFYVSHAITRTSNIFQKRQLLFVSIFFNLGMLCYFKYANFFLESFFHVFPSLGDGSKKIIEVILPPAISFYTFESLSYVIDVYRGTAKAEKNFWTFSAFVTFFPKLVAGPIERAHTLLQKLNEERIITRDKVVSGLRLYIWGLFKKIVIADNLGTLVDPVFNNPSTYSFIDLYGAALCFTFQIYGDFSGYTDMARGISRMMGMELSQNFNLPYFAKSISDFWRRWHITLGTWLKDYVFIPLGGSRVPVGRHIFNLMLTFFLSGLWHGASWNFVVWGLYYGVLLSLEVLLDRSPLRNTIVYRFFEKTPSFIKICFTFHLVVFGWIIFRSQNLMTSYLYVKKMVYDLYNNAYPMLKTLYSTPSTQEVFANIISMFYSEIFVKFFVFLWFLFIIKIIVHYKNNLEYIHTTRDRYFNLVFYTFLLLGLFVFGNKEVNQFIYFQF